VDFGRFERIWGILGRALKELRLSARAPKEPGAGPQGTEAGGAPQQGKARNRGWGGATARLGARHRARDTAAHRGSR
jgi:hypothetical protein